MSHTEELQKSVKRSEKKLLNILLNQIRYPLKIRVQDPWHKAYILLQTSIMRIPINDFTLRVEQSEIVEQSIRVLSALSEYSICNEKGKLLVSSILLQRSLKLRVWHDNLKDIFWQCNSLSTHVYDKLIENHHNINIKNILHNFTREKVQNMLMCNVDDYIKLYSFCQILNNSELTVKSCFTNNNTSLMFSVFPANKTVPNVRDNIQSDNVSIPHLYYLICYHNVTGKLWCYRKVECTARHQTFVITIPQGHENDLTNMDDLTVTLICREVIGIDYIQQPQIDIHQSSKKDGIVASSLSNSAKRVTKSQKAGNKPATSSNSISSYFPVSDNTSERKIENVDDNTTSDEFKINEEHRGSFFDNLSSQTYKRKFPFRDYVFGAVDTEPIDDAKQTPFLKPSAIDYDSEIPVSTKSDMSQSIQFTPSFKPSNTDLSKIRKKAQEMNLKTKIIKRDFTQPVNRSFIPTNTSSYVKEIQSQQRSLNDELKQEDYENKFVFKHMDAITTTNVPLDDAIMNTSDKHNISNKSISYKHVMEDDKVAVDLFDVGFF